MFFGKTHIYTYLSHRTWVAVTRVQFSENLNICSFLTREATFTDM